MQAAVGTPVLALAAGIIQYHHDAAGFGDPYPVLLFDVPIATNQGCYYGHNHPEVADGAHVTQGEVLAHAAQTPGGNAANLPGWLELGWWNNGPPPSGNPWTSQGQAMHDALLGAPVYASQEDEMLKSIDPKNGCFVLVDATGAVDTFNADGSPGGHYLGGLNNHPQWNAGAGRPEGPAVGVNHYDDHITAGVSAYVILTRDSTGAFHPYNFPSDGRYRT